MSRFLLHAANWLALGLIGLFVFAALAAPLLAPPDDPANPSPFKVTGNEQDAQPRPPGALNPLGTSSGQMDIYYTLVWGTRSALTFGLTVAGASAVFGCLYGAIAGYAGGWVNNVLMRFADALLAFPVIVAVWLFDSVVLAPALPMFEDLYGEPTLFKTLMADWRVQPMLLALLLFTWMPYARLVNARVLALTQAEFVTAARAVGVGRLRILLRYLLPNAVPPAVVLWARDVGGVVVLGTTFAFIGVGKGLEWGSLLVASHEWIFGVPGNVLAYWWAYVPLTLALVLFSIAWGLLGDGLQAALDPREVTRRTG